MKISREDVLRVAELANLSLSDAEIETYRRQLDAILTYIDKLKELDTASIEPMASGLHSGETAPSTPLREDVPRPCDVARQILEQAPEASAPYFRVPKVIER